MRLRAGLLLLVLALAGCGVPTSSDVESVRPGPEAGSGPPRQGHQSPNANLAATAREQVENFLEAAAGNPDSAPERVREYIAAPDRVGWRPEETRVVRVLEDNPVITPEDGGWRVDLAVQQVGILRRDGYLDRERGPDSYQFRVVTENEPAGELEQGQQARLRIADPPEHLLLADTALADPEYFFRNPIYFWDADRDTLVPDLRWLPTAGQPVDQHPWTVVQWLLAGPAPSLSQLAGMPEGSAHNGIPRWTDDGRRLVVNFNAAAVEGQSARDLAYQLAWSLLPLGRNAELELRIDDQPQLPEPIPPPAHPWQIDAVRFAVLDGVVRQVSIGDEVPMPALTDDFNQDVAAAALTSDGRLAALVRGGRLVVARAEEAAEPEQVPTGITGSAIGQPVWLDPAGDPAVGLVVDGGRLYRFTEDGEAERVAGVPGGLDAVAVSPEHRRLAMVVDGELHVGLLSSDGESVTVEDAAPVPTTVQQITEVAFSHETSLVVAGRRDGRAVLYRLTVDGVVESLLQDLGGAEVDSLVAHPQPDTTELLVVMYETQGQAYTFGTAPNLIQSTNLVDPPESADSSPRAPFFLE